MYMFVPGACVPVKLPAQSDWLQHNEPLPDRAGVFSVYIYLVPEIVPPQKVKDQKMHRVDGVKSNLHCLAPDESPLPVIQRNGHEGQPGNPRVGQQAHPRRGAQHSPLPQLLLRQLPLK